MYVLSRVRTNRVLRICKWWINEKRKQHYTAGLLKGQVLTWPDLWVTWTYFWTFWPDLTWPVHNFDLTVYTVYKAWPDLNWQWRTFWQACLTELIYYKHGIKQNYDRLGIIYVYTSILVKQSHGYCYIQFPHVNGLSKAYFGRSNLSEVGIGGMFSKKAS